MHELGGLRHGVQIGLGCSQVARGPKDAAEFLDASAQLLESFFAPKILVLENDRLAASGIQAG